MINSKKLLVIIFLLTISTSFVLAQELTPDNLFTEEFEKLVEEYKEILDFSEPVSLVKDVDLSGNTNANTGANSPVSGNSTSNTSGNISDNTNANSGASSPDSDNISDNSNANTGASSPVSDNTSGNISGNTNADTGANSPVSENISKNISGNTNADTGANSPVSENISGNISDSTTANISASPKYSLSFLIKQAKQNSYTLKAAYDSENAALAELQGAKGRRLPTFTPSISGTYIGNPIGPISITKGQLGSYSGIDFPNEDILVYQGMEKTLYNFGIKAEIPLYTWGKINLGIELAKSGLQAAIIQREKAEHELLIKIKASFEALAYIEKTANILELQQKICSRLLYISEKSADSGFITKAELANVKIKLKEADIALARVNEQKEKLLSDISSMCGLELTSSEQLQLSLPKAGCPLWLESDCYNKAIVNNYDLTLLDALLSVKEGMKDLAEKNAKGLPDIGLQVELSYAGSRFPFIEKDWFGKDDYQLTVSLGAQGGFGNAVKEGEAAKARAELAQTQAQRLDAERTIKNYLKEAYLGFDLSRVKLEYASLKQEAWTLDLDRKRTMLVSGAGNETEYLSTMIEALASLAEAYTVLTEYRTNITTLELIVGK